MEDAHYDIRKLMESSIIRILRDGEPVNPRDLQQMSGDDLLKCDVNVSGHKVDFFRAVIPGSFYKGKTRRGVGYHYRNIGVCASREDESAIELIESVYGTSQCWDEHDRLII